MKKYYNNFSPNEKEIMEYYADEVIENCEYCLIADKVPLTQSYTNSKKIYFELCDVFGWNNALADNFGRQGAPLCAHDVDYSGKYDVWFISHSSCTEEELKSVPTKQNAANVILAGGDTIIEKINPQKWAEFANEVYRITFKKIKNYYIFSGVYEIVENGATRVWKRISLTYPMAIN